MTSSEIFLKATLNCLASRFEKNIKIAAYKLAENSKVTPDRLKEEWDLFQEEVSEEVQRMEERKNTKGMQNQTQPKDSEDLLGIIDRVRAKVTKIGLIIEGRK